MAEYSTSSHPAEVPLPGQVISVALSLAATTVLADFLTQRMLVISVWSRLPLVVWLVFAIYLDSYCFVFAAAMLQHSFGVNSNLSICQGAILLCLVCYVPTKFIYLFLVEKAHIIRGATKMRLQSRLYLFNSFGMLGVYTVVVILNFIFRITRMEDGQCIIGMRSIAMIPLISFDAVVNVYLTVMFLVPLKNLYSFKNMPRTQANMRLRTVAFPTFIGSVCTVLCSIVNLSVLMALNGEPGWVCLMCCNCDILFSAIVIQWVTSKDNTGTSSATSSGGGNIDYGTRRYPRDDPSGPSRGLTPCLRHHSPPSTPADMSLVTNARCSHGDYEEESCDSACTVKVSTSRPGVTVTTTIERQSAPIGRGAFVDGTSSDCDGDDMFIGGLNRNRRSATWPSSFAGTPKAGSRGSALRNASHEPSCCLDCGSFGHRPKFKIELRSASN